MSKRKCLATCLLSGLLIFIGCAATGIDSISVSPSSQSLAVGQTAQLTATGITTHGSNHPSSTSDVTDFVNWSSSASGVATVSATGLVTAVAPGSATITASMKGFTGLISSACAVTVTGTGGSGGGGGGANGDIVSLTVIPSAQAVASPTDTSQFIAIGTSSAGGTVNLTSQVAWGSSANSIATVSSTGIATAVSQGTSTISAIFTNPDKSVATGTATLTVTGGTTEQFTAVEILPASQQITASGGQTGQFIAIATSGSGIQEDVTRFAQLKWGSSIPSIATISNTGLASGVSAGVSTITAELTNPDNSVVSATASVTVTLTAAPEPLLSLAIVPSTITVGNLQDTGQYLAIGTYSTPPTVRDVTNQVTWISSEPDVFPVDTSTGTNTGTAGGIVTAFGSGGAVIVAEATDPTTGSIQTATATFNCPLILPNPPTTAGSCYPGSQAAALKGTITIYNEGLNTTGWLVTGPSATGTPNVIHCGPGWTGTGGSVCSAPYPFDPVTPANPTGAITILLTAPAIPGVNFGGWSYDCTPSDASGNPLPGPIYWTQAGPNYCTVTMTSEPVLDSKGNVIVPANPNVSVGVIFN